MANLYISILIIFAAFGAFCFNMGHRRAFRVVLKGLLRGQIAFLSQRTALLKERQEGLAQEDLAKAYFSYETIGQLVLGWYKYFLTVRDDKELKILKGQMKRSLEDYLSAIEGSKIEAKSDATSGGSPA
jgi:hypothetical protein